MTQRQTDVVQTLQQAPTRVLVDLEAGDDVLGGDAAGLEIDGDLSAGLVLQELPQQLDITLIRLRGEEPLLAGVAAEDVGEARGDDNAEAIVHQRPDGMFARRAGAEVGTRDQDAARRVRRLVEDEGLVTTPRSEQPVLETGTGHALEIDR